MDLLELIMHTDDFLTQQVEANILVTYIIIFTIIYAESGIILFPFLPGDGFLFSLGVIAASTELNVYLVLPLCIIAAILGYITNYTLGKATGNHFIKKEYRWFRKFYQQTHTFLEVQGTRAVLLSRFFPIIRTYLPFVAGMAIMDYRHFIRYTIFGAVLWVLLFVLTGFLVGEIPWVQKNYGIIFLALVTITLIPLLYSLLQHLLKRIWKN